MERMRQPPPSLFANAPGTSAASCQFLPWADSSAKGSPGHEAREACFLPAVDGGAGGGRCSGRAREIAGAGRRRQRHSAGAGQRARAQRLGQRSLRHRQCRQGAITAAAGHRAGEAAQRFRARFVLPAAADPARGTLQAPAAICHQTFAPRGAGGDQVGGPDQQRRRRAEHLPGMLRAIGTGRPHGSRRRAFVLWATAGSSP
jgi:hypothetical protein